MGDGTQIQQAGDGKGKPSHDMTRLQISEAALANITASVYGNPSKPEASARKTGSFPITLADSTTSQVGLQGTYGAPALPVADVISRPKIGPIVPAQPYSYDGSSSSAGAGDTSTFVPKPYDIDRQVGGTPGMNIFDGGARLAGTAVGGYMAVKRELPTLTKGFNFTVKPFAEAPAVPVHTIEDFKEARGPAHKFLSAELKRLQRKAGDLSGDPVTYTPEQNAIVERMNNVFMLKEKTTAELEEGNNPIKKIDFSSLTGDTTTQRQFPRITEFQGAQEKLITERAAAVQKLGAEARQAYNLEQRTAKVSVGLDLGALVGSQLVDHYIVDKIAPRNSTSMVTAVTDFAAPVAAMAFSMTKLGKWAPLAKAGIIIGAHTISHLVFDQQVDEAK
jgi:hypothetical protein